MFRFRPRQWPGVATDLLQRLFTPFASGKATSTGLGLSMACRVVEQHGGQVQAAKLPAGGACFTNLLPLVPSSELAVADAPRNEEAENGVVC